MCLVSNLAQHEAFFYLSWFMAMASTLILTLGTKPLMGFVHNPIFDVNAEWNFYCRFIDGPSSNLRQGFELKIPRSYK